MSDESSDEDNFACSTRGMINASLRNRNDCAEYEENLGKSDSSEEKVCIKGGNNFNSTKILNKENDSGDSSTMNKSSSKCAQARASSNDSSSKELVLLVG